MLDLGRRRSEVSGASPGLDRDRAIDQITGFRGYWDLVVVGGGATGLGTAVDAAARGYRTLLLEQSDFAKGTSSRSTKLVHGGVRYLRQGNVSLVLEALHERGILAHNAGHLVRNQSFIVPIYDWWEGPFYGIGLKVYDKLAGKLGIRPSKNLSRSETLERIPNLEPEGLRGGVIYYDGQFDDSRLAINLAQTAVEQGATVLNYVRVTGLLKAAGTVAGVAAQDVETGKEYEIHARVVVNATGVFTDRLLRMDDPEAPPMITLSQGTHLVLGPEFLPGETAIMVPNTSDGRVLFAVPWHGRVVVGTTDIAVPEPSLEPRPLPEEVDFILDNVANYMAKDPTRADVLSVFAGLRPLVTVGDEAETAKLSRDHSVLVSESGLVTITGGKWTTYRRMAQDVVDQAAMVAGLVERACPTEDLRIHGWLKNADELDPLHLYGTDAPAVRALADTDRALGERLHERLPLTGAQVVWAARREMARTVDDVLARRTRALLLDARASIEAAPAVAKIMARQLRRGRRWQKEQVAAYSALAGGYILETGATAS
jgi:glycerol-3-phosphate dehydrogenase